MAAPAYTPDDPAFDWLAEAYRRAVVTNGVPVAHARCLVCGMPVVITFYPRGGADWDCPGCYTPARLTAAPPPRPSSPALALPRAVWRR